MRKLNNFENSLYSCTSISVNALVYFHDIRRMSNLCYACNLKYLYKYHYAFQLYCN